MAILKIRIWPDPALKEVAKPVSEVSDETKQLVDDLFETMHKASGVGLAATQVAQPVRILVLDLDPHNDADDDEDIREELESWGWQGPRAFINPEILEHEGSIVWEEGCLSVPGYTDKVKRHKWIRLRALNTEGVEFEVKADGLFSVALQHEMDHLDGKVFVEYLSKLKRDVVRRKMDRIKNNETEDGVEAAIALRA